MNPQPSHLQGQLKGLKLSAIGQCLELRLLEAQQNHLSYGEFLSLLLSDEQERRLERKLQRLLMQARLAHNDQTLESFDFLFNPAIPAAHIRQLACCHYLSRGHGVFLIGPTGTGKTHLAKALAHEACRRYHSALFFKTTELWDQLKLADQSQQLPNLLKKLIQVDLLVLDDFGLTSLDAFSGQCLYHIVDERYTKKSIILTSNRSIADWLALFDDPIIANACLDRLAQNSYQIVFKGESYRKKSIPKFESA